MQFLYRTRVARVIALLAGLFLVYYVWWRVTQTLNPDAMLFSVLLFAAELHGIVSFYLFAFMVWTVDRRPLSMLRPNLTVDIFVPTYNESVEVLEATLTGCNAITYPHTTYLLDDGRRPEVARLAEELGVRYLTRPDNQHAKAGNLNAALAKTTGEFIVVLDADMVPQPDLLDQTLGYFADPKVALVQLPQEFYNQDSVQHADDTLEETAWHEQALFYRLIQPGKNRWNAAFWCGSPSVVRRAALEDVGGVATDTVTEDIHTSVRLHARGWKSVYHNETLAYGIAPQTFQAFAIQRLRWAQGTMQLLRSPDNPLLCRGLTLPQRLNYLASMLTYFDSYQKLIYLLAPSVVLVTGILPLDVPGVEFLMNWVPYFGLTALANIALGRGYFRFLLVEQYNLLKLFVFLWATTFLVWPRKLDFRVTPKQVDASVTETERLLLRPQVAVLTVIALSVLLGLANLVWGVTTTYSRPDIALATVVWALANAGLLILGVRAVLRRLHGRATYRFPVRVSVGLTDVTGRLVTGTATDLSPTGAGVRFDSSVQLGKSVIVVIDLPTGLIGARGEVRYAVSQADGGKKVGVRFIALDPADRERLILFLYVSLPRSLSVETPPLERQPAARVA